LDPLFLATTIEFFISNKESAKPTYMEPRSKRPDRKAKATDQSKVLKLKKYFDKKKTTPKASSEDPPENNNKSLDFKETTPEEEAEASEIRPDSPEPNCAICLEPLTNKSFTDSCFHTFCFTCLVEWSRVKPECPLCKQRFKSIVHNVQKDYTYEEYHITSGRSPHTFWTFLSEAPRFRYPTTMTPINILRRNLESLQESLHGQEGHGQDVLSFYNQRLNSQIESHRRRYAPHSVRVFSDSSIASNRPSFNYNFRNRVYTHDLWVMPAVGDRVRTVSPEFYRRNPACTHRLLPWLNRELVALLQNQETQVTFVLELIMALIARYEITSQEFFIHIEPYLGDKCRHFIHELYNFAISPHNMEAYDRLSNYSGPTHNRIQEDDVIPIESENPDSRPTSSAPVDPTKFPLRRILIKKKSENQWETVPVQSSSSAGTSAFAESASNPGPSTSGSSTFVDAQPTDSAAANSDNEEECQIVEVLKPKRERTPEIVDLSSDEEVSQVVIEVPSDDTEYTISESSGTELDYYPRWPLMQKSSNTFGSMISQILAANEVIEQSPTSIYNQRFPPSPGSDSEIECVYSGQSTTSKSTPVPVEPVTPSTTGSLQENDVPATTSLEATTSEEPSSSVKVEESTSKNEPEPKKPKLPSAIVRPWEGHEDQAGPCYYSTFSFFLHFFNRPTPRRRMRHRLYTSSSDEFDDSEDKEPRKKLKLRSVVAHFTFDSSGKKCESRHRPSHKKRDKHRDHRDKKTSKEKRKRSHKHKHHRIYSESDSS
ncbi:hypothetical protein JTE90_003247, partial [Oedothorax gibbosus]